MPRLALQPVTDRAVRRLLNAADNEPIEDVQLGNALTFDDVGQPVLPFVTTKIAIPAGYDVAGVDVLPGQRVIVPGSHLVRHGIPPLPGQIDVSMVPPTQRNPKTYASDDIYPSRPFEVCGIQKKCGVSILGVLLRPVEYMPRSGRLSYFAGLQVVVHLKPAAKSGGWQAIFRPDLDGSVADAVRQSLRSRELQDTRGQEDVRFDGKAGGMMTPLSLPGTGAYYYVIVTNDALKNAAVSPSLNDLVNQRKMQGFTTNIVTMEYINANYTGVDSAEKLRNFIRDAYNNWGTRYVLLCGDTNVVPCRVMAEGYDAGTTGVASDLYFSCLDGTYDYDADGKYGEVNDGAGGGIPDFQGEVRVGRCSAEDANEMSNFIYKVIAHENDAYAAYVRSALFTGELLDASTEGSWYADAIRFGSTGGGLTTVGFTQASPAWTTATVYFQDYGSDPALYDPAVMGAINSNNYSMHVHGGHGWAGGCAGMHWMDNGPSDLGTDTLLTNTKFLFMFPTSCEVGYFNPTATHDGNCFAEHMTTSTRHALYGCVMSSNTRPYSPGSHDGDEHQRRFFDQFLGHGIDRLGDVLGIADDNFGAGPCQNPGAWPARLQLYESTLFGDPLTRMRGSVSYYTITASAGTGGSISPTGTVYAESSETRVFTITPNVGYLVNTVTVDSVGQGSITTYTFTNVQANHTISVTFKTDPNPNLLAYYKFNETSGTTASDSSGHGLPGTLVSGPTWVAGKYNNAVSLDGIDDHVSLPNGIMASVNDFTISAWVKLSTNNYWNRVFDFGNNTSSYMVLTPMGGAGVVRYSINTGAGEQIIDGTAALPTGSWQHVAVTLSGTTGTLYVNAAPVGTNSSMINKPSGLGSTSRTWIGRSQFAADPYFNGQMDEFRIYRRALSGTEITALYNNISYNITASAGTGGTITPSGTVVVTTGTNQTFNIAANTGYVISQVTVDSVNQGAISTYTFNNVIATHTISATFVATIIPRPADMLFSAVTDTFPASGSTGNWASYIPSGQTLTMMATPTVETINSKKWEQNLYADGDGYDQGTYSSSIACTGASIIVAIRPTRTTDSGNWRSIVDIFYDRLVLGVHNNDGIVNVRRNGSLDVSATAIPNNQLTVLSLVAQSDGKYKVWANGTLLMNITTTSALTSLVPGVAGGFANHINLGRNNPDTWTTFNGNIGDVYVYKTALTDTERRQLEGVVAGKFGITLNRSVPQTASLLFSAVTDTFPASGSTGNWASYLPSGQTLTMMATPTVNIVGGARWEQNIYADGDGYLYQHVTSAIPVNGVTVVVTAKPTRVAGSAPWTSIVDILYDRVVIGIHNDTGIVCAKRNFNTNNTTDNSATAIPDGQRTVLSFVIQPDSSYKVWANGTQIMTGASQGFTVNTLDPNHTPTFGSDPDWAHYINVGRNNPDGWTTFNGDIGDVFVYKVALSDADRQTLEADIRTKFGF